MKTRAEWENEREVLLEELRAFARLYDRRPFNNSQGLRGVSAFALFWFLRRVAPSIVFEVGVWKGFSTWIIEQAAPAAVVHSFDPLFFLEPYMSRWKLGRTYRPRRVTYHTQEFSCAPVAGLARGQANALAFFDDHQNKLPRLLQCKAAGIRHIVFDDNLAEPYTHRTLEHERAAGNSVLDDEIECYEIFPALWPFEFHAAGLHLREEGMGFPIGPEFRAIHRDRKWHSYVTYVRLAAGAQVLVPRPSP